MKTTGFLFDAFDDMKAVGAFLGIVNSNPDLSDLQGESNITEGWNHP